jgi:hypothetical protein
MSRRSMQFSVVRGSEVQRDAAPGRSLDQAHLPSIRGSQMGVRLRRLRDRWRCKRL